MTADASSAVLGNTLILAWGDHRNHKITIERYTCPQAPAAPLGGMAGGVVARLPPPPHPPRTAGAWHTHTGAGVGGGQENN